MIVIGVGANLPAPDGGTPLETCRRAVTCLDALPGLRLHALSRWYLTDPVPPSGQPPYVNAIAVLQVELGYEEPDPSDLLSTLHGIEAGAGRHRTVPNASRTLDLDIIAMGEHGGLVRAAPDPVLPHPRAHLRRFVLMPMLDVFPDWVHPILGCSVAELLQSVPDQGVRPLA